MAAKEQLYTGTLEVAVHSARDLHSVSFLKMDCYAVLRFGKEHYKTSVSQGTNKFPVWGQHYIFHMNNVKGNEIFRLKVKNEELLKDDDIGEFTMSLEKLLQHTGRKWVRIVSCDNFTSIHGEVDVTFNWKDAADNLSPNLLQGQPQKAVQPVSPLYHQQSQANFQPQFPAAQSQFQPQFVAQSQPMQYTSLQLQPQFISPRSQQPQQVQSPVQAMSLTQAATSPFHIIHLPTQFILSVYGSPAHESPLIWQRMTAANSHGNSATEFVVDTGGLLKHAASALYVHPKGGILAVNNPLVLANGIGESARFLINESFLHNSSKMWLSHPASVLLGQHDNVGAVLGGKLQLQAQTLSVAAAPQSPQLNVAQQQQISPSMATRNNQPFYLVNKATGELIQPNESSQLALSPANQRSKQAQFIWKDTNIQHLGSGLYVCANFDPKTEQNPSNPGLFIDAVNSTSSFLLNFAYSEKSQRLLVPQSVFGLVLGPKEHQIGLGMQRLMQISLETASSSDPQEWKDPQSQQTRGENAAEGEGSKEGFELYVPNSDEYIITEFSSENSVFLAKIAKGNSYGYHYKWEGMQLISINSSSYLTPLNSASSPSCALGFVPMNTASEVNSDDSLTRLFQQLEDGRLQHLTTALYVGVDRNNGSLILTKNSALFFQQK
jgi:hypothetical protein